MQFAADLVNILTSTIESVGFDKKDLKTTSLNIRTHCESFRDKDNNYKSKFDGFIVYNSVRIKNARNVVTTVKTYQDGIILTWWY